jgi:hypothetical protein
MIVRIGFRLEAESELTEARDWYRERGLGLGDEILRAVDSCLATISNYLKAIRSYIEILDGPHACAAKRSVGEGQPNRPSCSQNAHDKAVLVRCAK